MNDTPLKVVRCPTKGCGFKDILDIYDNCPNCGTELEKHVFLVCGPHVYLVPEKDAKCSKKAGTE